MELRKMNKGIVMEITSKQLVVMTSDGQFTTVKRRQSSYRVGEEIYFSASVLPLNIRYRGLFSVSVAAIILALIVFSGIGGFGGSDKSSVAAYVTVDINPSIELGID